MNKSFSWQLILDGIKSVSKFEVDSMLLYEGEKKLTKIQENNCSAHNVRILSMHKIDIETNY